MVPIMKMFALILVKIWTPPSTRQERPRPRAAQ
jgi:hypothetical protein